MKNALPFLILISLTCSLLLSSCDSNLPTEQLALEKLNENVKPPLQYTDLKKIDAKESKELGADVYRIQFQVKLVADADVRLFTHKGWNGMDTIYVASTDTSMLNKIAKDIKATNEYNKTQRSFEKMTTYTELKSYKKGDLIKEETRGLNFIKSDKGWNTY